MSCGCVFLDAAGDETTEADAVLIFADVTCPTHYIDPTED